jgi:hypothetical protein
MEANFFLICENVYKPRQWHSRLCCFSVINCLYWVQVVILHHKAGSTAASGKPEIVMGAKE